MRCKTNGWCFWACWAGARQSPLPPGKTDCPIPPLLALSIKPNCPVYSLTALTVNFIAVTGTSFSYPTSCLTNPQKRLVNMRGGHFLGSFACLIAVASAACPILTGDTPSDHVEKRQSTGASSETESFLSQFYINDNDTYLTTDVGGPIADQNSLKAGSRGSTLLEDFILRQKIQHFDHERVSSPSLASNWLHYPNG